MEQLAMFFQETGFVILMAILQILVCVIAVFLVSFVKKLCKKAGLENDERIFESIELLIQNVVVATNQKIVDKMKEANQNGKLTDEQAERVFNEVKTAVYACLSSEQVSYLINQYGNVDNGLVYLIETSVKFNHDDKNKALPLIGFENVLDTTKPEVAKADNTNQTE